MPTHDRRPAHRSVLSGMPQQELAALRAAAPELEIEGCDAAEIAPRTLELRPWVVVLDDRDAERGLRSVLALRRANAASRILFITPPGAERERLEALEAGVDEALARPLAASEVAGRIRLLLRRSRGPRRSRLPIGLDMELDADRRELLRDGQWIHLRPKEAHLLELFARSPGRTLTREYILERVWGPNHEGDPRTVDVHVRWLRMKIEADPHEARWLRTVRGAGYRLETA